MGTASEQKADFGPGPDFGPVPVPVPAGELGSVWQPSACARGHEQQPGPSCAPGW